MNATQIQHDATLSQGNVDHLRYATTRFGVVSVAPQSIVEFPLGLIGIGGSEYALLSTDPESPFQWMQSLERPELALPVTNPHRFFRDFSVELAEDDAEHFGLGERRPVDVLVTVTAAAELSDFTVNLRAPILIHEGRGYQLMNQAAGAAVKSKLFPAQ
jgi:flagellar assembly factor FliW